MRITAGPAASRPSTGPRLRASYLDNYDELAGQWWDPRGPAVSLGWIARSRAALIPEAGRPGAVLLDVACGGGLLHPHVRGKGYRHVGVDLSGESLKEARSHGLDAVIRGDIARLPLRDESVDVVAAGQCLEHVPDMPAVLAECCRVLRPGGTLVLDTIADTAVARLLVITLAENIRFPGKPPKGCHDHRLFVDRARLLEEARRHGVPLRLRGLIPRPDDALRWLLRLRPDVRMQPVRSTAVLFQAAGVKRAGDGGQVRA